MKYILLLLFLPILAVADPHPHDGAGGGSSSTDVVSTLTSGDLSIAGDSSRALGLGFNYGMSDVDINEGRNCMGSENGANILWGSQKLILMPWCAALFYDANGNHKFAAKMRCDIDGIRNKYETLKACWKGQTITPAEPPSGSASRPTTDPIYVERKEAKVYREEVQQEQETFDDRLDKIESGQRYAAQKAQERRDFAQMTIERLEDDPEE